MARQIVVEIIGDEKRYTKALDTAQSRTGKFTSILQGVGMSIGQGIFGLAADGLRAAVGGIQDAIGNASKLEQSAGAVEKVFGSSTKKIEEFGKSAANNLGLSKTQVNEMAAVMGAQLQGMGFEADEAAERTMNLQQRAADMAATFGGTTKDAVEAITSLMRGERDPIEKFGVSIKQADVNARILALGLDTSTAAAKKNAEATAAMDLLMEQTAKTSGQFASESGSLAGQQQITAARMENLSASIGQKLMPVMVAIQSFVLDSVIPAMEGLFNWLGNVWDAIQPGVKALVRDLTPAFKTVVGFISGTLIPIMVKVAGAILPPLWNAIKTLGGIASAVFGTIVNVVSGAVSNISGVVATVIKVFNNIVTTINTVKQNISNAVNAIVGFFSSMPSRISGAVKGMWDGIWNAFRSVINSIIRGWNSIQFTVPSVELPGLGKVGGFTIGTPNIPYLHSGGIVPGVPGSDVLAMLQAGERVVSRRDVGNGAGGITINIEHFVGSDSDIDRLADRLLTRLRVAGAF